MLPSVLGATLKECTQTIQVADKKHLLKTASHVCVTFKPLSVARCANCQPVVAAIPGAAAGAGLSIALSTDLRVAAERALFVTAFANVGASGDFGMSWFLPRVVGEAKAKELMFTSPRLSARDALALGMVSEVFPDASFTEDAMAYCQSLAQRAPIALRYMKENINRSGVVTIEAALDAEAVAMSRTMSTADHREAAAAFVEKRTPNFDGR